MSILKEFQKSLSANGVSSDDYIADETEDTVSIMFRMPYKKAAFTVWLYESKDDGELALRTTATRAPGQDNNQVLVALNAKNSGYPAYNYFIDPDYPSEIGIGRLISVNDVSELYEEMFYTADDVVEELKDYIEFHEE